MTLETNEIPGNMGFLDMLLALEWVNDHIRYFNGDKGKVTLMGQSAGAAAVTFFLTSPLVREGKLWVDIKKRNIYIYIYRHKIQTYQQ